MTTTTVSSKGQITLPAKLVRSRGLSGGSRLELIETASGAIVLLPLTNGDLLDTLAGSLPGIYSDSYVDELRTEWPE